MAVEVYVVSLHAQRRPLSNEQVAVDGAHFLVCFRILGCLAWEGWVLAQDVEKRVLCRLVLRLLGRTDLMSPHSRAAGRVVVRQHWFG